MYVELCMEFGKTEINFQQSSNLQGVIMENISTEYAGILHGNQLNPYSQYVSKEENGTYGYRITQDVRKTLEVSESTLYPVLRRLQKDECLEVYDMQFDGRNRRYYKLTEKGQAQLNLYKIEWKNYSTKIGSMFEDVGRNADSGHMREEN